MNTRTRGFVMLAGVCWLAAFSALVAQELKPFVPAPAPVPVQAAPVQAAPVRAVPATAAPIQTAPVQTIPVQTAPVPTTSVPAIQVPGNLPTPVEDRPSQSAVPTKEVPSPAEPSNMPSSVAWGLGAVYVYESLKKSGWFTFISDKSTQRAKVIFGFITAFLTAAGIQFVVSGSVLDAGGASVSFTGITLIGIKDVLFQWAVQQGWYDLVVHRQDAGAPVDRVSTV